MNLLRCLLYLFIISVVIFLIGRIYPRKWIKEDKFPWIFAIIYGICNISPILIQRYNRPRLKASARFVRLTIKQEVFDTHIQLVPNSTQEELRVQANIEPSILREAK